MNKANINLPNTGRMHLRAFVSLVATVLLLGLHGTAWAQEQAPFSESELTRCLTDTPQLIDYVISLGGEAESLESQGAAQQLSTSRDAQQWLADKGWQPVRYSYVLDHVARGYAALQIGESGADVNAQMQQVMNTPGMSPQMMAQMQQAMQQFDAVQSGEGIPASEMALIKSRFDAVENMLRHGN